MFIVLDNILKKITTKFGLIVSSSITETVPATLYLSSCLECAGRSVPGSLILVTTEFSDAIKTFLSSYFETRTLVIL